MECRKKHLRLVAAILLLSNLWSSCRETLHEAVETHKAT